MATSSDLPEKLPQIKPTSENKYHVPILHSALNKLLDMKIICVIEFFQFKSSCLKNHFRYVLVRISLIPSWFYSSYFILSCLKNSIFFYSLIGKYKLKMDPFRMFDISMISNFKKLSLTVNIFYSFAFICFRLFHDYIFICQKN